MSFTRDELMEIAAALDATGFRTTAAIVKRELDMLTAMDTKARCDWDYLCGNYGLTPNDYGKVFHIKRQAYEAIGINPNAPKFCVNAKRLSDGKIFRVPARCVK